MKKRGLYAILLGMAVMSFTLFNSCDVDIGLGAAVDVEPPSIEITYPPTASIICDEFQINGNWNDDGSIQNIKIELKNSSPDVNLSFGFDGKIDDDKKWSTTIDPIKNAIPDGEYEATIKITDNGGHSSSTSRSFVIDNTAPVIVLERPSTIADDDDSDLFGQKFTLKGQAADTNDISLIRINFYADKECKTRKHYIDLKKIPPTIDMDVASFELNKDNDYKKIYDSFKKDGKKNFYFTIEAYDGACRYNGVDPVDKSGFAGNKTDSYYQYSKIYKLLSEYKATGLYNILNGTYTSGNDDSRNVTPVELSQIKETLKNEKNKAGRFSLNPANNPEFKVVGWSTLTKDGTDFTKKSNIVSNESKTSLKVAMGLDSIPVEKDSLKIYLLPCNENGEPSVEDTYIEDSNNKRVYTNRFYIPTDTPPEPGDGGYTLTAKIIADNTVDYKGDSKKLSIGETYIIAVEGYDQDGNEVVAEDGNTYGFKLAPNGAAPIVEIKTCVNPVADASANNFVDDAMIYVPRYNPADISKESVLRFEGTVQVADGIPSLEVKIDNEAPADSVVTLTPVTGSKGLYKFVYTLPVNKLKDYQKNGQHNIVFDATLQDSTQVKKSIMYQVDVPKVTLSRVEPFAYKYTDEAGKKELDAKGNAKRFLNGKNVKLNVTIIAGAVGLNEEDDDKKAKIEFIQNNQVKLTIDAPTLGETPEIDTTQFNEGSLLIRITAYDMAGNKTVVEDTYYVDQTTDIPVILPKNSTNSTLTMSEAIVSNPDHKGVNVYSATQTVSYKLIDDDGLEGAIYKIYKPGETTPVKEGSVDNINGSTDYQLEVEMPEDPATYKVYLYTKDVNAQDTTGSTAKTKSCEFYIRITASAPKIESIKLAKTNYKNGDHIRPQIKIKSDQIPFILTRKIKNNSTGDFIAHYEQKFEKTSTESGVIVIPELGNSSPTITDDILIDSQYLKKSGDYTIFYTVEDKNGKTGDSDTDFVLDLTAPKITKVQIADRDYAAENWNNSKALALSVTANDVAGETGIEAVQYSTNGTSWTALSPDINNDKLYTGSAVFTTEGKTNPLYIRAKDYAGNITYYDGTSQDGTQETKSVNVQIDTSAPILTVDSYQVGELAAKEIDAAKIYVKDGTTLTLSGTYKDIQSGIEPLEIVKIVTDENDEIISETSVANPVLNETTGKWTATYSLNSENKGKLLVRGLNKAGGETSVSPFEVEIDSVKPELKNISLSTNATNSIVYKKSDNEYYVNNKKKFGNNNDTPKFTVSGIATDNKGIDSVIIKIGDVESAPLGSDFKLENLDWSSKTGSVEVTIKANDIAGNESTPATFTVYFDTEPPASVHLTDTAGKDLYFRIGNNPNDDIAKTQENTIWKDALDLDIGGKYKSGTFGNNDTIQIRGNFEDKASDKVNSPIGSGVNLIYYKLFENKPEASDIQNFLSDYKKEGYFAPLGQTEANAEERRVFYTDNNTYTDAEGNADTSKNGSLNGKITALGHVSSIAPGSEGKTKYYVNIKPSYKTTISGFKDGKNYLVLLAVDNVGNAAVDVVSTTGNQQTKYYSINEDTKAPETASIEDIFIDGKSNLEISLTVTDNPKGENAVCAGIRSVKVLMNGLEAEKTAEPKDGKYVATITAQELKDINSGTYSLSVTALDNAGTGNSDTRIVGSVIVDKDAPSARITSTSDFVKSKIKDVSVYVTDTNGLSKYTEGVNTGKEYVTYKVFESDSEGKVAENAASLANGEVLVDSKTRIAKIAAIDTSVTNSSDEYKFKDGHYYVVCFTATDKVGNKTECPTSPYTIDRTGPGHKDSESGIDGLNEIAKVNAEGKWFKGKSFTVEGKFEDKAGSITGSGVTEITYTQEVPAVKDAEGNVISAAKTYIGIWKTADGSYSANLGNFEDGTNILTLVAKDKLDNPSSSVIYSIKVDNSLPQVVDNPKFKIPTLTNGTVAKTFEFEVTDTGSGIETAETNATAVSVTVGGNSITSGSNDSNFKVEAVEGNNNKWKVTVTVGAADLSNLSGNNSVIVTIRDKAGNESNPKSVGTLNVDSDKPKPEFTSHTEYSVVNKIITLSGKVTDDSNSEITEVILKAESGNATPIIFIQVAKDDVNAGKHGYLTYEKGQWTAILDTRKLHNGSATKSLKLTLDATDKADNKSDVKNDENDTVTTKTLELTINQNADRPIVKFNNLTREGNEYILKFGTDSQLEGNVSDDDSDSNSVVTKFFASSTQITSDEGWVPTTETNTWERVVNPDETDLTKQKKEKTKFDPKTGDYTFTPADVEDGLKQVYFYVEDNNGEKFYTGYTDSNNETSDVLFRPYQQFKTLAKVSNEAAISYKSDKTAPTISSVKIQAYTDDVINGEPKEPGTSTVVGGTKKNKIKLIITASDANGIKDMSLTYTPKGGTAIPLASTSGSFAPTTTNASAVWTTDFIDVSGLETGSVNVAITATDQCGLSGNASPVFMVDNTGPNINISSPSETDEVTGKVSIAGQATDADGAGNPTINFLIPTKEQQNAAGATSESQLTYYKSISTFGEGGWIGTIHGDKTPSSFEYIFNGDVNDNASLDIYTKSDNSKVYDLEQDSVTEVYSVPIFFRSEDALGNVTVKKFTAKYNPDADKPKTEISYPSVSNYESGKDYVTLGGLIRVTGSITIPSLTTNPEKVYIQIAAEDGDFGETDKTKAAGAKDDGGYGYSVKSINDITIDGITEITGLTDEAKSAWWGIEAVRSSNAWSFNLNDGGNLNLASSAGTNNIKIRVCGVNAVGKMGNWSEPVNIHIDASAPSYTTKLYQISSFTKDAFNKITGVNITSEKNYEAGIFLKGQWYIGIHMVDDDKVTVENVNRGDSPVSTDDLVTIFTADEKTADVYIKLTSASSQTYKVTARDRATGNYHYVYPTYEIKVDNDAPVLSNINAGDGYPLSMTKQRTSNKTMTFGATAKDEGSGFSRLAYYFKRGSNIELPLPDKATGTNNWELGSAYSGTLSDTDSNLYGVKLTGNITNEPANNITKFTNSSIPSYPFIRKGAIVKLAGTYHLISSVDGDTITVTGIITAKDNVEAFFPAAFIVDNSNENSTWAGAVNTIERDDGDGVTETVTKSGSTWTWDTSIYAGELDDGEVTLVCVAFDNADNASKLETTFMIANKTPRLSKLYLATDLNGDGKYSDNELGTSVITSSESTAVQKYYSALNAGSLQEVFTVYGRASDEANSTTDSGIIMRDKLGMAFEFVSGNENYGSGQGDLKYKVSVSQAAIETGEEGTSGNLSTASGKYDTATDTITSTLKDKKFLEITPENITSKTYGTYKELKVSGEAEYSSTDNYLNYLHITLWDNANNAAGTKDVIAKDDNKYTDKNGNSKDYVTYTSFGAQWTAFNIPLYMDLVDGVKPTVTIENPVVLDNGHIDLSSTLDTTVFDGSNEMDTNDKVSGKFKFTGTFNDDKRIADIKLTVNKKFSDTEVSSVTLATYDATNGRFKKEANGDAVIPGSTTIVPNDASGLSFKILESTFSTTSGHTVSWELGVDSSLVADVAAADVKFTLTANDGTSGNDGTAEHQVDIVPYITEITRSNTISGGVMNRSKNGRYPVSEGETLTVKGYNLGTSGKWTVGTNNSETDYTATKDGTNGIYTFTMVVPARSGELSVATNSITSLNNKNNNSIENNIEQFQMSGSSTKYTASDNRYLSIWNLGNYFTSTNGGYESQKPVMTADKDGNLRASWGAISNSNIMFSQGLTKKAVPIYRNYDQPAPYSGVAIDTKSNSNTYMGSAVVTFIQEHGGNGNSFSRNGLSSAAVDGGAAAIQINKKEVEGTMNYGGMSVQVTGNPKFQMDGTNYTAFFNLANYDGNRRFNSYVNPESARYDKYTHSIWYDNVTESLKYSVVDVTDQDLSNNGNGICGAITGWVVLDGGYTGLDRKHTYSTTDGSINNNTTLYNNGYGHVRTNTTNNTYANYETDFFLSNDVPDNKNNSNNKNATNYISNADATSITYDNLTITAETSPFTEGDTIALLRNYFGEFYIAYRTITKIDFGSKVISWSVENIENPTDQQRNDEQYSPVDFIDGKNYLTAAIYHGNMNVVSSKIQAPNHDFSAFKSAATDVSSSAGSSAAIDVLSTGTEKGYPVVAYYDATNSKLKVVCASNNKPDEAANWTRLDTGKYCSGEVSMKIDGANNIHIMYNNGDGQMCYLFGKYNAVGNYTWGDEELVDETGALSYGSISIVYNGTTYVPAMTYLNKANTANAVKYAYRTRAPDGDTVHEDRWDFMIIPALGNGHYALKENKISIESSNNWTKAANVTDEDYAKVLQNRLVEPSEGGSPKTATPATVQSVLAYKTSKAYETAYLKKE